MKSMVELSHLFLEKNIHKQAICLDGTLGQGKDSLYFLKQGARKVYAFEIQKDVYDQTMDKIHDPKLKAFCISHEYLDEVIHEEIDAAIFNFGYDPKGSHAITTQASSSLLAVQKTISLLKHKGKLALVMYPHEEGNKEALEIEKYLYDQNGIHVYKFTHFNIDFCPYLLLIEKM